MADESAIRALLVAHAPLTALVGTRIYDQMVPTAATSPTPRPYLLLTVVSDVPFNEAADAPGAADMRLQFDAYADNKASAKSVLAAVRAALHAAGYVGSEDSTRDLPADDPALRRISSDWSFILSR